MNASTIEHLYFGGTIMAICRNCNERGVNRPRGLCWTCYYSPGVREKFPSTSKFAHRGVGNFTGNAPLPSIPTSAAPGTAEKVSVLEERARMKQALWHPLDATGAPGETTPVGELVALLAG
jgi:hypothetical protein